MPTEIPKDLPGQIELIKQHPWMISNIWSPNPELQRMVLRLHGHYLGSIKGGLRAEVLDDPVIKDNIIRHMLELIRDRKHDQLKQRLEDLNWVRASWPELRAIRRSLEADQQNKLREDTDGDETIDDIVSAMTNGGSNQTFEEAMELMGSLAQDDLRDLNSAMSRKKSSILANLVSMFFSGDDVRVFMELLDMSPARWPELNGLPDSVLPLVKKEFHERTRSYGLADSIDSAEALAETGLFDLDDLMDEIREVYLSSAIVLFGDNRYDNVRNLSRDLSAMIQLDADTAELKRMLDKRKTKLMVILLSGIKGRMYQDVNVMVDSMRTANVDWPELDVIERSMSSVGTLEESYDDSDGEIRRLVNDLADTIALDAPTLVLRGALTKLDYRHGLSAKQIDELLAPHTSALIAKFKKDLSGRSISIGIKDLAEMARLGLNIKPFVQIVQDNKDKIMRFILNTIRERQNTAHCLRYVEILERIGMDWPEFSAIRKAADAEYQEIRRKRDLENL